jgi:hypothetical protein
MSETPTPRPVDPGPPPEDGPRAQAVVDLLRRFGWVQQPGGKWSDPKGADPSHYERRAAVELPAIGGGKETIFQVHCAPAAWSYPLEEAFLMQLQRGISSEHVAELIKTKERELEALKKKLADEQAAGGPRP